MRKGVINALVEQPSRLEDRKCPERCPETSPTAPIRRSEAHDTHSYGASHERLDLSRNPYDSPTFKRPVQENFWTTDLGSSFLCLCSRSTQVTFKLQQSASPFVCLYSTPIEPTVHHYHGILSTYGSAEDGLDGRNHFC